MLSKKWKAKFQISVQKSHIPGWRPAPSLIPDPFRFNLTFKKGYPQFNQSTITGKKEEGGQKKYKPKAVKFTPKKDYDESNFHEIQGTLKFALTGRFTQEGAVFEKEIFKAADDLYLTGNLKCRASFARGELQGDVYALSYLQKWIQQGQHSLDAGRITSTKFYDDNYGVPPAADPVLRCVKDWRKYYLRRAQTHANNAKVQAIKLQEKSTTEQYRDQRLNDDNEILNY